LVWFSEAQYLKTDRLKIRRSRVEGKLVWFSEVKYLKPSANDTINEWRANRFDWEYLRPSVRRE
ncbi:MAG: hypothetical protein K2F53_04575, partial [Rikenellaceae bacterium]|nr:hypothetical protein [Rikenellaceae bacterium]